MPNYQKLIIIGHMTRDPQLSYTPQQTAVTEFGIATNRKWKGQDGREQEEVLFVDCVCFGKRGEAIQKYCLKGDPLLIEGRLKLDQWQAQDGTNRSKHRVIVENFQFMGSPKGQSQQVKPDVDEDENIPF